jgi:hypothetical protein
MATKLNKNVTRESSSKYKDREIMVTLNDDQSITLKLKGLKSGSQNISLIDLYGELSGDLEKTKDSGTIVVPNQTGSIKGKSKMIDLNALRSINAISMLDLETMTKFDGIIAELLRTIK